MFNNGMIIPNKNISYLYEELYEGDTLKVLPSSYFKNLEFIDLRMFLHNEGIYCIPTTELIEWLREEIGDNKAIEIGAGHGVISRELDIIATDSYQQCDAYFKNIYEVTGQPPVKYGKNVLRYESNDAISIFKPHTVIGSWITHKYDPKQHYRKGNMAGVREEYILRKAKKYILIGNKNIHAQKPILDVPHKTFEPDWIISRTPLNNIIYIWDNS